MEHRDLKGLLVLAVLGLGAMIALRVDAATTLSLCNRNPDRAIFAAMMQQVGGGAGWQATGWFKVEAGKCSDLNLGTYTGKAYVYAEDEFEQTNWGDGTVSFCVNRTQAFTINNADTVACTDPALKKVNSDELAVQDGSNVWEAKPNFVQLNFCNQNASIPIAAAYAKQLGSSWQSMGWYQINAGKCQLVTVGKYSGQIQFYGEYNFGELAWGSGPFEFCVDKSNAFNLANADQAASCTASNLKMVKSSPLTPVVGVNTVNFQAVATDTTLNLCNQTTLQLFGAYAVAGSVAGQYRSTGWFSLDPQKCHAVDLGTYTGTSYLYAEYNGGEKYWGSGPVNFCVNKTQAFTIDDSTNAGKCSQDIAQKMVPSFQFALVPGTNTFTFNP